MMKILRDKRGGGAEALKGLAIMMCDLLIAMMVIDIFYICVCYSYIKVQMDMSNRAVYSQIDMEKLSEKIIYIDKVAGENEFYKYLMKNLKLDSNFVPLNNKTISGAINIKEFKIYNDDDLPNILPSGEKIEFVTVYSQIEVKIKPIFFGVFGEIVIEPYLATDIPGLL